MTHSFIVKSDESALAKEVSLHCRLPLGHGRSWLVYYGVMKFFGQAKKGEASKFEASVSGPAS